MQTSTVNSSVHRTGSRSLRREVRAFRPPPHSSHVGQRHQGLHQRNDQGKESGLDQQYRLPVDVKRAWKLRFLLVFGRVTLCVARTGLNRLEIWNRQRLPTLIACSVFCFLQKRSKIAFSDDVHAREELLGEDCHTSEDQVRFAFSRLGRCCLFGSSVLFLESFVWNPTTFSVVYIFGGTRSHVRPPPCWFGTRVETGLYF